MVHLSIKLRLALLLGLLLAVFLISLGTMHTVEMRQHREIAAAAAREEADILGR